MGRLRGIGEGVGEHEGGWFENGMGRHLENDESSFFWIDPWLNGGPLRVGFGKLFDIFVDTYISVA